MCEPLTGACTLLPPVRDELLDPVRVQLHQREECVEFFALFDPSGGNDVAQFRVMCWMHSFSVTVVFVYSSVSGSWTRGTSVLWPALGLDIEDDSVCRWYTKVYGCLYWDVGNKLIIKFHVNSMEFTAVSLLSGYENRDTIVVEAGEGRTGMFSLIYSSENPPALHYIRQNEQHISHLRSRH